MAKGISIHIGLNYVDPDHYNGWDGKLNACEYDARDMKLIADSEGFQSSIYLREEATRQKVIEAIQDTTTNLDSGDILFISYSGHGGQVPDLNSDESDSQDETWCLFDGELIDDELKYLWSKFREGVRILVISDSCHSGTITKEARNESIRYTDKTPRYMPVEVAAATYFTNKDFYDELGSNIRSVERSAVNATVKLISGCQDNQYSYDGTFNGQFTGKLKAVWNGGAFGGNYYQFHKLITNSLPQYQTPNYLTFGKDNSTFDNQKPFTI